MKKINFFFLFVIAFAVLAASCSSTKGSSKKGGGWYQNRNVDQSDTKDHESIVYQTQENIIGQLTQLE